MKPNDDNEEKRLRENAAEMKKLRQLFGVTFVICAVPEALYVLWGLIQLCVLVMTVAVTGGMFSLLKWVMCAAAIVCFAFSDMMKIKESLIKSGAQIAQSDFSSDCIEIS